MVDVNVSDDWLVHEVMLVLIVNNLHEDEDDDDDDHDEHDDWDKHVIHDVNLDVVEVDTVQDDDDELVVFEMNVKWEDVVVVVNDLVFVMMLDLHHYCYCYYIDYVDILDYN